MNCLKLNDTTQSDSNHFWRIQNEEINKLLENDAYKNNIT